MKTKLIISSLAFIILGINQLTGQPTITLTTPRGTNLTAYLTPEIYNYTDKLYWGNVYRTAYPNATEQGYATTTSTYNCHSYAWNMSEGGPTCWIGPYSQTDEDIYWTDQSYIETTEPNASKISYYADNHSARQTSTQGMYISKWGNKVLMLHARDYGPAEYQMGSRKYYRLNLGIYGATTTMCANNQRTFTSNSVISGSTYSWSRSTDLLNYVSGAGTTSYTVQALSGPGSAWISLQMTTPSGEVATKSTGFWVGEAQVQSISGPSSTTINTYNTYYANTNNSSGVTWEWAVTPTGPYLSYLPTINSCVVVFYSNGSYQLRSRATNSCGTTTWYPKGVYVGGKSLSLYPNPTSDNVTISIKEDPLLIMDDTSLIVNDKTEIQLVEPKNYTIRIFNSQGNLLSTIIKSGKVFTIPLTNLPNGTYLVKVNDEKTIYTQQLIIKH